MTASPQLEDGYFQLSIELFDAICRLKISGSCLQCLNFIIRKTYGFHKKSDHISLSQFHLGTGLTVSGICVALKKLQQMNIIATSQHPLSRTATEYRINKDYTQWMTSQQTLRSQQTLNLPLQKIPFQPLNKRGDTKYNNTKDNNTKDIIYPPHVPMEGENLDGAPNWRSDFSIYLAEENRSFKNIISDFKFLTEQKKFYPNIDLRLTLEKSHANFWSTEAGWKNKKRSRSKEIDWIATWRNSLSNKMNWVRKNIGGFNGGTNFKTEVRVPQHTLASIMPAEEIIGRNRNGKINPEPGGGEAELHLELGQGVEGVEGTSSG